MALTEPPPYIESTDRGRVDLLGLAEAASLDGDVSTRPRARSDRRSGGKEWLDQNEVGGTRLLEAERSSAFRYQPRSSRTSLESLRRLAGSIPLTGPVPSGKFLEEPDNTDVGAAGEHGRH